MKDYLILAISAALLGLVVFASVAESKKAPKRGAQHFIVNDME